MKRFNFERKSDGIPINYPYAANMVQELEDSLVIDDCITKAEVINLVFGLFIKPVYCRHGYIPTDKMDEDSRGDIRHVLNEQYPVLPYWTERFIDAFEKDMLNYIELRNKNLNLKEDE